jgi:hypothetical protein
MAEGKKGRAYNTILAAIASGFATFAFFMAILMGMGFRIETAVPIAYTIGFFVFGAFLYKIYRRVTQEPPAVETPALPQPAEEPMMQKCLILAARTHGALQDRANYWLSGKYGTVKSSAVSATEKGIFMTIFYEVAASSETPALEVDDISPELPRVNDLAPLRNFR